MLTRDDGHAAGEVKELGRAVLTRRAGMAHLASSLVAVCFRSAAQSADSPDGYGRLEVAAGCGSVGSRRWRCMPSLGGSRTLSRQTARIG